MFWNLSLARAKSIPKFIDAISEGGIAIVIESISF
jgi:hypothetical protein